MITRADVYCSNKKCGVITPISEALKMIYDCEDIHIEVYLCDKCYDLIYPEALREETSSIWVAARFE